MATYEEIYGKRVEVLDTDPTLNSAYEGQVWYNSASGTLKSVVSFASWSAQPNTINDISGGGSMGFGTSSTSALYTGGGPPSPATAGSQKTEEWNGSGFEAKADIPQTQNQMNDGNMGFGTTTSGLVSGSAPGSGAINNWSQDWNGTSWEATPTMPTTGRGTAAGYGVLTAGLNIGGYGNPIPPGRLNRAEEYTGSAWTSGGTLSTARYNIGGGAGTQTSAAACGGEGPSAKESVVENYDGSSFTAGVALPQAIRGGRTAGTSDSAFIFWGGFNPSGGVAETLEFDGTSFTDLGADMGTQGSSGVCAGTTTAAINIMSGPSPGQNKTQQFNKSINTITAAAWASGGNLNTVRTLGGSAIPTVSDGIVFGGSGYTDVTEKYNGTSWTTLPATLNTARGYMAGFGTSTAAVSAGGYTAPNNPQSLVEEYNGSSWSEETNLPAARKSAGNCGTLTAGLIMGGSTAQPYAANVVDTAFEYDGTSWTATPGNMPEAKGQGMSGGTQTAAYYAAGRTPPNSYTQKTAEYNGSSFSEGGNVVTISETTAQGAQGATGTQTAGLATGGQPAKTNTYDGTAWATTANFNTGRNKGMGGGTATAALIAGGGAAPGNTAATEEFTGATETATASTLTTS